MTSPIFFDTDCLSSFLWVKREDIISDLYSGRISIPVQVYTELSYPSVPHLKHKIDVLIKEGKACKQEILTDKEEGQLYYNLILNSEPGSVAIGKGEASVIALAKCNNGIVASNNLKDISRYIKEYDLELLTTGGILVAAYKKDLIDEMEGNEIWEKMTERRSRIGASSFTEFLKREGDKW